MTPEELDKVLNDLVDHIVINHDEREAWYWKNGKEVLLTEQLKQLISDVVTAIMPKAERDMDGYRRDQSIPENMTAEWIEKHPHETAVVAFHNGETHVLDTIRNNKAKLGL